MTAQTTTPTPAAAGPQFRLRLPGRWHPIPLQDHKQARAAVRALTAQQLGTAEQHALARIDLERRLLDGLEQAITGDGHSFYIALTIVPGVPIPITAMVATPTQQLTPAIGTNPQATMDVLAQGLANLADGGAAVHQFTAGPSRVARRTRYDTTPTGDTPLKTVVVEYWLTVPGTKRFLLVQFRTPLTDLEQALTGLFDSIITASRWD